MSSLSSNVTRHVAGLTIGPLIAATGVCITIVGILASTFSLPGWIGLFGLLSYPLLSKITSVAQQKTFIKLYLHDPDNPSAGKEDFPFRIVDETLKLRGEVHIPEWTNGVNIIFQEHQGYSIELGNYTKGVESGEKKKNKLDVEKGVPRFDFTVIIKRKTSNGGTYRMEVKEQKYDIPIDDYKLRLLPY